MYTNVLPKFKKNQAILDQAMAYHEFYIADKSNNKANKKYNYISAKILQNTYNLKLNQ